MNFFGDDKRFSIETLKKYPEIAEKWLKGLTPSQLNYLPYWWEFNAREEQIPPEGDWRNFLALAGRGWGKTRTGAEWIRKLAEAGNHPRLALIAPTPADARDVMVEGDSGILAVSPPSFKPHYEPSKLKLTWPNGVIAKIYSAAKPEKLRGPQHHAGWADELCAWDNQRMVWDMLKFGMRLNPLDGTVPKIMVTTTPKPTLLLKELVSDPKTYVVKGSTYDNKDNLSEDFLSEIRKRYEGTSLGAQEIYAEILAEQAGALWTRDLLDRTRHPITFVGRQTEGLPEMRKIVVAIDPQSKKDAKRNNSVAETGIVLLGLGEDEQGYVLKDVSGNYSPEEWAQKAITLYNQFECNYIVAESNHGGDMVESNIQTKDPNRQIKIKMVSAKDGKWTRAEPIASIFEQNRAHIVGHMPELEDQLVSWTGENNEPSPDRLDAMVWGLTDLMLKKKRFFDISLSPDFGFKVNQWKNND